VSSSNNDEGVDGRRNFARLRVGVSARFNTLEGSQKVRLVDLSQAGAQIILSNDEHPGAGLLTWLAVVFACAAVASALVDSLSTMLPVLGLPVARASTLVLLFAVLALVNIRGVVAGTRLASAAAIAKSAGLLLFVLLAARYVRADNLDWSWPTDAGGVGRATVLTMFALAGMEVPLCAGGEIRDPSRTVPRALAGALAFVILLYVTIHLVAQGVLGAGLADSQAPLADALAKGGQGGRALLLAVGGVSMFGYLAGDTLGASRILFAFGRDGLLPRRLAAVHPDTRAPHVAIIVHALAAAILAMTGSFAVLAPIASVAIIVVYLGCCAAAWALSKTVVVPLLAIAGLLWVASHSTGTEFLAVGAVLLVGSVVYFVGRRIS